MQPWMIIAGLMGLGVLTLLVAPRLHRRSTARARREAAEHRVARANELRASPTSVDVPVSSVELGHRLRDALLLRGVRSAVVGGRDGYVLVVDEADSSLVGEVLDSLDPDSG